MRDVHFCAVCNRIVETRITETAIGNIRVPVAHKDRDGDECSGVKAEAETAWS